ncbi:hypothetical protein C8J57DRAFT_1525367 [Mycena rebaudengoi]|nr:hypothetical protein C8J57DRAFT_1525367 [Mycena rebaudengoi]
MLMPKAAFADQVSLFHVLYRTIALASPRAVLACCDALIDNPELALLVRNFDISASKLDGSGTMQKSSPVRAVLAHLPALRVFHYHYTYAHIVSSVHTADNQLSFAIRVSAVIRG